MTKTVRMKETTDISPAGPNKKNRKRRVEQDTLLSRQLRKKNPTSSVLSFPVFIFFFHCVPFCSRSAILSYSLLSQALAPFVTSLQGRNSHFFKKGKQLMLQAELYFFLTGTYCFDLKSSKDFASGASTCACGITSLRLG